MTKEKKLNKFNYHYEFCERNEQRKMYEEEIDRAEQLEEDVKELKKRYYEIDAENTDLFSSLDKAYKEEEALNEEITKLKKYKKAIKILKEKLSLYLENDKIRAILPIGVSDRNKLNQEENELLKEVLNE